MLAVGLSTALVLSWKEMVLPDVVDMLLYTSGQNPQRDGGRDVKTQQQPLLSTSTGTQVEWRTRQPG